METINKELSVRLRRREAPAWREAIRVYGAMVLRVAHRVVRRMAVAQEVAQETWINALRCVDQLRDEQSLGGWLSRIARNVALTVLRSPTHGVSATDSPVDKAVDPWSARDAAKDLPVVWSVACRILPKRQLQILYLSAIEELPVAEVAQRLDLRSETVTQQLSRARGALRSAMPEMVA